jgi:thiamine transport system substrate-binding protein
MRHFFIFFALILGVLFFSNSFKNRTPAQKTLKIFASSSFINKWGPGPSLKENFEKTCLCTVEFFELPNAAILTEKLKSEKIDLVMGFDQFDLDFLNENSSWKKITTQNISWHPKIVELAENKNFIAYDWGILSFLSRKSETQIEEIDLFDLLNKDWKEKISMQDPRTSSLGLQFILWVLNVLGKEEAFPFLEKMNSQVLIYAPSWSTSYGLFQKKQVSLTFSYVTSALYHQIEENNSDIFPLAIKQGHPMQIEYMGIPDNCIECEMAESFVKFILNSDSQQIIMKKNYMFPVIKGVEVGTPFESYINFPTVKFNQFVSPSERELVLKKWSELRKR